jgi:predicted site-specific integrase-resolvase
LVEELWDTAKVIEHLGININNLRQLQYRRTIAWVKKEGKRVFYSADDVKAYRKVRESRKAVK